MKVLQLKAIQGPNTFHHKPVLAMSIDLQSSAELCSAELPGFNERLLAALPGLAEHHCSPGRPGGFVERLERGTYFAHIIEHIALELSELAGIGVHFGKTVYEGKPGHYRIAVRFKNEAGMSWLLFSAVGVLKAVTERKAIELEGILQKCRELVAESELGPSTAAIVKAAEKRGIPWARLDAENLIQFGYGINRRLIRATTSSFTSDIAVDIAQDKNLTKQLLDRAAIKVPKGEIVYSEEEAVRALNALGVPVAVKPLDGNHGNGVSLGLTTESAVRKAFSMASGFSPAVLVEELFTGADYRVLVVGGKMAAAARRVPAHVMGDGRLTVAELVEKENTNPARGNGHEKAMTKLPFGDAAIEVLRRQGFRPDSVPTEGARVYLCETANISQGGSAIDVTDLVHPETRAVCERAARIVGLDICGIDLVLEDIGQPVTRQAGGIIEVNAGPGIRMHHFPSEGTPRDVGDLIMQALYPPGSQARVPIVSITGTNGKTTVTRLVGHTIAETGVHVGITTSDGIYMGQQLVAEGDTTGPASARAVLCDPGVEMAVLETARGGIVRRGLGYDWSDVGVITNIQPDHFGQDGIETVEDVLHIKRLVAERVRDGGTLVLNADDPMLVKLGEEAGSRKVAWFTMDPSHPMAQKHVAGGGVAYFLRDGWIVEARREKEMMIAQATRIPITFGGAAHFHVANALAAVAACRALGLSVLETERGLCSFEPNLHNAGRSNIYKVGKGYVLVDYGHNPEAIRAVGAMASRWGGRRRTGVIAVPGDRSEDMLRMAAAAAAESFDKILIREDLDLRGRQPGEAARILLATAQEISGNCDVELDGETAFRRAVSEMEEGELVVFFYEDISVAGELLRQSGAVPLWDFRELEARVRSEVAA